MFMEVSRSFFLFAHMLSSGEKEIWRAQDGTKYQMPQHGFAKDAAFRVRSIDQSGFEVELIHEDSL